MKTVMNVALKLAIFESRKKQKRIAQLARIPETQLSHIVRGRRDAKPDEQARLAAVLGKPVALLFIVGETAPSVHGTAEIAIALPSRRRRRVAAAAATPLSAARS